MRRKSWKGFHKTLLSAIFQSLAHVCVLTRGLLRGECSLNVCAVLYFSEIKWFRVSYHLFTSLFRRINFVIPTHVYLNFYSLFTCSCLCVYLLSYNNLFIFSLKFIIYFYLFICTHVYLYSYAFLFTFYIYVCL
jgi:hypothetical protein